jgi:gliding motility-associated-like protein
MKYYLFLFTVLSTFISLSQNVQVDSQTYTAQELIEDILIDSGCIENVVVTNVVGGDFNNTDQSYGYFDANGSSFPLQSGIVLSTGRLQNVEGPNTTLSDDDASNWSGDNDLETVLNESNTTNATILEFDFTSVASQISFRYVFASEEYQEGNANTCQYSDLFGFLIRPANSQQYTNIALVPNTQTPVKVTTVHPEIPGACAAENEAYFESWNGPSAPINFNGQTKVLTATANVTPNETYHVKLVIADEQNYRYDSAVFLEAGSFVANTNLGPDRLVATNNPICEGETFILNAFNANATGYIWYKDGIPETTGFCANCSEYVVSEAGIYNVDVQLGTDCISYGEIVIEYSENPIVQNTTLTVCDNNSDGIFYFNLNDAEQEVINGNQNNYVSNYFITEAAALSNSNHINNSDIVNFQNTTPNQTVFARVENPFGCASVAEITLQAIYNPYDLQPFTSCDDFPVDGFSIFNLNDLRDNLEPLFPTDADIAFYETEEDASSETNAINGNYQNTTEYSQTIFVKVTQNNSCITLSNIQLQVLYTPTLEPDVTAENPIYYCLNSYPETITLYGGVLNDLPNNYYYSWSNGEDASYIEINEPGTYSVTVTDPNGCSNSRSIVVSPSNIATIDNIEIVDASNNNTITVLVSGEGDYEYSLDNINGPYQDENFFNGVSVGFHNVYVKDKNDCGISEELVSVIGFPKFFTPNNDGQNDTWQIKGVNQQFQPKTIIYIFNRHGKLLAQIDPLGAGWNGTYNGNPLPSDDYWFSVELQDGRVFKNHFTLKR